MPTRTIAFIHGNFVTKHSWSRWIPRYEAHGYRCVAIEYPGRDKPVVTLKQNPTDPFLSTLDIKTVIDHHAQAIQALDEKPIIIGHSFGGLLTQLMLQRGLGVAAVAIDSVPPLGVIPLTLSFYLATWPLVNPLISVSRPYYMPFTHFRKYFANSLPEADLQGAYDADLVPESRRLSRGALTPAARINFKRPRAPLLMIAGGKDRIMPAAMNRQNFKRYRHSPSVTDFREFEGRCHYAIIAGKGWEEVADFALHWAERVQSEQKQVDVEVPVAARQKVGPGEATS